MMLSAVALFMLLCTGATSVATGDVYRYLLTFLQLKANKRVKQQIMHTIKLYTSKTLYGERGWSLLVVKCWRVIVI